MKIGSVAIPVAIAVVVWVTWMFTQRPVKGDYIDSWDNGSITINFTCYYTVDGVSRTGTQQVTGAYTEADEYLGGRLVRATKTLTITDYLTECH